MGERARRPPVPVFALGRYAGARRHAIIAMKDHGRADLVALLAQALAVGAHRLLTWGNRARVGPRPASRGRGVGGVPAVAA